MSLMFLLWIVIILIGIFIYVGETDKESMNKINSELSRSGVSQDDIKISLISEGILILTNDNKVFASNSTNGKVQYIDIENVLDISSRLHVTSKNKKRLIALTSTYDSNTRVEGVELKLRTEMNTFKVYYGSLGSQSNDIIDKVERFELIVKREINKVNSK